MYQREAMWMSFSPPVYNYESTESPFAVKISVGGVNALTGLSQRGNAIGKQDYLVVCRKNGQL
jgi:hypothetical protein